MSYIMNARELAITARRTPRIWIAVTSLVCIAALSRPTLGQESDRLFTAYCDPATVALWLFDEPLDPPPTPQPYVTKWYYTQTITDASRNYYDLIRLHGGAIDEGRFGRALRVRGKKVSSGMQLAANFAGEPRIYGIFLPADHEFVPGSRQEKDSIANYFWYTVRPDKLVDAIQSEQWTLESWVRIAHSSSEPICVFDAGQGTSTAVRLELLNTGSKLRLTIGNRSAQLDCSAAAVSDGQWHHVALSKAAPQTLIHAFIDGKKIASSRLGTEAKATAKPTDAGLVIRTFDGDNFDSPFDLRVVGNPHTDVAPFEEKEKSIRLRGWIKSPFSGDVRFETDTESGLHFDVDHRPLIYGWFGRAAMYRRSPRWGEVKLKKGELYPVLIEKQAGKDDLPFSKQRIYWSWEGQPKQPIPDSAWFYSAEDVEESKDDPEGGFQPDALMRTRFNLTLGSERSGRHALDGWMDELRISNVARYESNFTPATHSLNYGPDSPATAQPNGPPLLFAEKAPEGPLPLGSRRHLFIDDALIGESEGWEFVVHPPQDPVSLTPDLPAGDHSFFELDGQAALFAPAGYEGRDDYAYLWVSDDGVNFRLHESLTSGAPAGAPRRIMTDVPAWGRMAIDTNPTTPAWARFKYTAGVPHRGIYLLVSPDAIHWRRNETIMLQLGTGGESHWYWDDQRGEYRYLLKWDHGPGGRQTVEATTHKCFEPWPLRVEGDPKADLATPLGYMPTRFAPDDVLGEVYRSRGVKYPWAPDVYVAFLWRFDRVSKARQVELAVSRDGERWTHFGDSWYMPAEIMYHGEQIHEVTSVDGMIRRGEEIWQYADYSTGRHDSSKPRWRVRLRQRLDGFVSLDTSERGGRLTTKPFTFSGNKLSLNAAVESSGSMRIGLVESDGTPIPGFTLEECEPIEGDSTNHVVTWNSQRDLNDLAGKPIRVICNGKLASLYAMQFE